LELPIPFIGILEEGYFFVFLPFKCLKKFLITPLTFYRLSLIFSIIDYTTTTKASSHLFEMKLSVC